MVVLRRMIKDRGPMFSAARRPRTWRTMWTLVRSLRVASVLFSASPSLLHTLFFVARSFASFFLFFRPFCIFCTRVPDNADILHGIKALQVLPVVFCA